MGRFAPTPSGPLHFGSVIAALASYLDARKHRGKWLLRFDDIDTPRNVQGAIDNICSTLEALGMEWDDRTIYQSAHLQQYQERINYLDRLGMLYQCYCTRKQVKGKAYPGTCRDQSLNNQGRYSLRIKVKDRPLIFNDLIQGNICQDIAKQSGDFIVVRSDQIFSYNLVAAIDDAHEITHVIRGADLADTTAKQIYLQNLLGLSTPIYGHIPIAVNTNGKKLSKQHGAIDILCEHTPSQALVKALDFLGQSVDENLETTNPETIMQWALENWSLARVPKVESIVI